MLHKVRRLVLFIVCGLLGISVLAQPRQDKVFSQYAKTSIPLLREFLAIPNDAHMPNDIEQNVKWCEENFKQHNFITKRLITSTVPLLLAERKCGIPDAKTVLVYLQVDGQPVDPAHWFQKDPYQAVLKQKALDGGWEDIDWSSIEKDKLDPEWRIFARSTSDSKGAVIMFLTALKKMADDGRQTNFDLKVIMDFEEELGSPNLPKAVKQYKDDLEADMLIIFDGPRHITNQPTLTFGARGISTVTLKVFGPYFPQHSGHYGNYIPNPALRLSQLLSSMKDREGRVTIQGFYDGISISDEVKEVLKSVPDDEKMINLKMGIASGDSVANTYQESLQYPSLNVRGMLSGWVGGESRTIVPAHATAEIDIRLVIESDPDRLINLIKDHIVNQGYLLTDNKPTATERAKHSRICQFSSETSYLAYRTAFDSEVGVWLDRGLQRAFDQAPIKQRTSGGSIPISPFVNELGIPAVTVPTVNRDNNQHSPNENIRLGNYIDGIKTIFYVLTEPLE